MLKDIRLAARFLRRDYLAGEWYIIIFSLILAASILTALHSYTNRIMKEINNQSVQMLGGDLVVSSSKPIPDSYIKKAQEMHLTLAQSWSLPSVASTNTALQLINLQAVSSPFPIVGDKRYALKPMHAVVEPRLLSLLKMNASDKIQIGKAHFQIELRPAQLNVQSFNAQMAPLVIISLEDIAATNIILPGSRVEYRLLLAGEQDAIAGFKEWLTPQLSQQQKIVDVKSNQFVLNATLTQINVYIETTLLVTLLMCGIAIFTSSQSYLKRHLTEVALWRCFGATKAQILRIFLYELGLIAIVSGLIGVMIGLSLQYFIDSWFRELTGWALPATTAQSIYIGFAASVTLLLLSTYQLIASLPGISPVRLWRDDLPSTVFNNGVYTIFVILVSLLMLYVFFDLNILLMFLMDAILLSAALLYGISIIALRLINFLKILTNGVVRRGLSQLTQHADSVSLQMTALSLIIIFILTLNLIRSHLLTDWERSLAKDAPNYFIINLDSSDREILNHILHKYQVSPPQYYPLVRGRLTEINHQPWQQNVRGEGGRHNALHRELNLSEMYTYPSDNQIIEGSAWNANTARNAISIEQSLATALQAKIGDTLTFTIGAEPVTGEISNIRTLDWKSLHPNFYIILYPGNLDNFAKTFMTSLHLSAMQKPVLNEVVSQLPNATMIDISALLEQVQSILRSIVIAMQLLFLVTLIAGSLMAISSFRTTLAERRFTYQQLRVLGANNSFIYKSIAVEMAALFTLITLVSIIIANAIYYTLVQYFLTI